MIAFLLLNHQSKAQNTIEKIERSGLKLSAGVTGAISTGDFNDRHKWGLGGYLQADLPISGGLHGVLSAAFINFFGKDTMRNNSRHSVADAQFLPVKAGLKYYVFSIVYVQADAGVSFVLNKDKQKYSRSAAFIYAPQAGISLPVTARNNLDIAVAYDRSSEFVHNVKGSKVDYFSLKVGFQF